MNNEIRRILFHRFNKGCNLKFLDDYKQQKLKKDRRDSGINIMSITSKMLILVQIGIYIIMIIPHPQTKRKRLKFNVKLIIWIFFSNFYQFNSVFKKDLQILN